MKRASRIGGRVGLVDGIRTGEHVAGRGPWRPARRTSASAGLDEPLGVLVGRRRRQHEHLVAAAAARGARGRSRSRRATRRHRPGRGSRAWRHATPRRPIWRLGCYPIGSLPRHDDQAGWGSSGRGSWGRASPRWRPRRARRGAALAQAGDAPTPWWRRSRSRSPSRSSGASSSEEDRDATLRPGHRHRRPRTTSPTATSCIESVVEDLAVKKELFTRARPHRARTTPSSPPTPRRCPVVEMAVATERPDKVVRRPLLQPGADDEPGRDRPAAHRVRRDHRRGQRVRRGLRQGRRSRSRTAPASSSTPCCSRTSTTRCGCSRTARPTA